MLRIILVAVVAFVVFGIMIFFMQDRMIFFPSRLSEQFVFPPVSGRTLERVSFQASDGTQLSGVLMLGDREKLGSRPVILFSHGNAGHLVHRHGRMDAFSRLDADVFLYDYRGFGASSGIPSVAGVVSDAVGALDYLVKEREVPLRSIILYGESVGAGIAVAAVVDKLDKIGGLVLEAGFRSLSYMAGRRFPLIGPLLIRTDLPSATTLSNFKGPLLVIHSRNDEIIPFEDGKALFDASPSTDKEFLELDGFGHNDPVWHHPDYHAAWAAFVSIVSTRQGRSEGNVMEK